MNKKTIIAIVIAGILLLGSSGVYATGQIARSNAISESDAINFACVDAGVTPEEVSVLRVEFDFEAGKFVYDIEFYVDGMEYDYKIDSMNGEIVGKSFETYQGGDLNIPNPIQGDNQQGNGTTVGAGTVVPSDIIGIENAKAVALASAGFKESDVVFSKAKLDRDDGRNVYDIEFYVYDKAEYSYEIDATNGTIIEEGFEPWEQEDYIKYAAAEKAQNSTAATNNGSSNSNSSTGTSSKPATSGSSTGTSSKPATSGSSASTSSKPATSSSSTSTSSKPATSGSSASTSSKPATSSSSASTSNKPATSSSSASTSSKPATSSSSAGTSSKPATSSSSTSTSSKPATSSSSTSTSSKPATSSSSASASSKPATSSSSTSSSSSQAASTPSTISVEQAKSAALSYAGASAGSVVFEKAKLERENGSLVYEIEFYVPGYMEYEVDVDAYSGSVLYYDYEYADDYYQQSASTSAAASAPSSSGSSNSGSNTVYYDDDYDDDDDDRDDWDDNHDDYDDRDDWDDDDD